MSNAKRYQWFPSGMFAVSGPKRESNTREKWMLAENYDRDIKALRDVLEEADMALAIVLMADDYNTEAVQRTRNKVRNTLNESASTILSDTEGT